MKKQTAETMENGSDTTKGKVENILLLSFSVMLFLLSMCILYYALVPNYLKGNVPFLTKSAVRGTGSVLLAIALMNIYVTRVSNRINFGYSKKLKDENVDEKYKEGCSYCGEEKKRLICGSCDSILWYKIDGWHDKICFFAAHRRNLVNGVLLTALLVTPLTFLYQQIDKKLEAYNAYEQKSIEARNALNNARGLLLKLEKLDNDYLPDTALLLKKRSDVMDAFQQEYRKASWLSPLVVSYFASDYCDSSGCSIKDNLLGKKELDTSGKILIKKWENGSDFFKSLDGSFSEYISASDDYYDKAYIHPRGDSSLTKIADKRRRAAEIFYKKGQIGGCLLFHISFDNIRTESENNQFAKQYGCDCYFDNYFDKDKLRNCFKTSIN